MKAALTKAAAVLLLLALLASCGNGTVEVTPSPEVTPDFSFSDNLHKLVYVMAHDHFEANVDYLNSISRAFEESGENVLYLVWDPSDTDRLGGLGESIQNLPEELGNAIMEYASNAVFCNDDSVGIGFYNLEYWREHEEELRDGIYDPPPGDLRTGTVESGSLIDSGFVINEILNALIYAPTSKVYGNVSIGRASIFDNGVTFGLSFSYYENSDDIYRGAPDEHWRFYGNYDVMWGL